MSEEILKAEIERLQRKIKLAHNATYELRTKLKARDNRIKILEQEIMAFKSAMAVRRER